MVQEQQINIVKHWVIINTITQCFFLIKKFLKIVLTKLNLHIIIAIVVNRQPVHILYLCRCGGTGRRTGLKILRLNKPCRFDSGHLHHTYSKGFKILIPCYCVFKMCIVLTKVLTLF